MRTVVVADDEPSLRLLVSATIASDECHVLEASDGDEAWHLLHTHRPDVALLDVQMPRMTGLELTRAIKSSSALRATRIVLLSAKAQESDVQDGLDAGADRYLTKPFSPFELLAIIDDLLEPSAC
ncbi:MAG: response regulator [Chloroflexota bacterium]